MEREPQGPGWYTSERSGYVQYHDGQRWTDEYYPAASPDPTPTPSVVPPTPPVTQEDDNAFANRFGPRRDRGFAGMWNALVARPLVTLAIAAPAAVAVFVLEAWDPNPRIRDRYGLWVFVAALVPMLAARVCLREVPRWVRTTYFGAVLLGVTFASVVLFLLSIGRLAT